MHGGSLANGPLNTEGWWSWKPSFLGLMALVLILQHTQTVNGALKDGQRLSKLHLIAQQSGNYRSTTVASKAVDGVRAPVSEAKFDEHCAITARLKNPWW